MSTVPFAMSVTGLGMIANVNGTRAASHAEADLSQQAHRLMIGVLGLLLPWLVLVLAGLRPTPGLDRPWEVLDSISAYFYTGGVGVFSGVLIALSMFLATYRGYQGMVADRRVGQVGGLAAVLVAVFPTGAPKPLPAPAWWTEATGVVHYVAAVVLFGSFILFSLWLFRKSDIPDRRRRPVEKRVRDAICLVCGLVMIGCVLWAGSALVTHASIFLPEAIAVEAFAVSWLAKAAGGRARHRAPSPR